MLRLALENRLQDRGRLELVDMGFVGRGCRDHERQGIEDLHFVIGRMTLGDALHRRGVGTVAGWRREPVVIGIEGGERLDQIAFARCLGADRLGPLDRVAPLGEVLRRRCPEGIEPQTLRDPPMGDRAVRIDLESLFESPSSGAVPERVLVKHGTVEQLLRLGCAGRWEVNFAQNRGAGV
jgi:hypothetical protein